MDNLVKRMCLMNCSDMVKYAELYWRAEPNQATELSQIQYFPKWLMLKAVKIAIATRTLSGTGAFRALPIGD
jgi:hypothetical protein